MKSSRPLTSVAPWEVRLHWSRLQPLLEKVLALEAVDNRLEDVYQFLLSGKMQAWHGEWKLVVVTEVIPYGADAQRPTKLVCNVTFCAGEDVDSYLEEGLAQIEACARSLGCTEVRIVGRRGWIRKLQDYDAVSVTLRKRL